MPNKSLLITRPFYDLATTYLFNWSEDVINYAKNKNINIIDLKRKDANRNTLEERLIANDPVFVIFNGHGNENCITGLSKDHILVQTNDNEKILKSRIVYSISCKSAKVLGHSCIDNGTEAFIGFDKGFAFWHDETRETNPKKDKVAAEFLDIINSISFSVLNGSTAEDAVKKAKVAFEKRIEYYRANYHLPESFHLIMALRLDRNGLVNHGNKKACI